MNRFPFSLRGLVGLASIVWAMSATVCHAVSYTVTVDTIPLASQTAPPAPFSLEFQLIDGGGTASNTATLSNFDFGAGGGPTAAPPPQAAQVATWRERSHSPIATFSTNSFRASRPAAAVP